MDSEMIKALETLEHRAWWRSLRPGQHVIWNRAAHLVLSAPDEDGMVEIENVAPVYMPDGQDRRRVHGSDLAPSVWR